MTWSGGTRRLSSKSVKPAADAADGSATRAADAGVDPPPMALEEMERRLIRSVLQSTGGNRTKAAEVLGISREGLRTKMQRLALNEAS